MLTINFHIYFRKTDVHTLTWEVNSSYNKEYPAILALIDLILTLPAHFADAEIGFSKRKKIKTVFRSKLQDSSVSDMLTIQLRSASIKDFNLEPSILLWNRSGQRAVGFHGVNTTDN